MAENLEDLVNRGLVERIGDCYSVPPVMGIYLTSDIGHSIDPVVYREYSRTITLFYISLYEALDAKWRKTLKES